MDITPLKEKLGDETFAALSSFIEGLEAAKAEARRESIEGRKGLKAKVAELEGVVSRAMEKLGIDSPEDIDSIPDAKGAAEAAKQYEAKLKRAERERDEFKQKYDDSTTQIRKSKVDSLVMSAVRGKQFVDDEVATMLVQQRVRWEGDEPYFEAESGKLVSIDEGVAWLAKSKPTLVKAQGSAGSGYRDGGGASGTAKNPFAKDTFNLTEQIVLQRENPQLAAQLKAAAQPS